MNLIVISKSTVGPVEDIKYFQVEWQVLKYQNMNIHTYIY